MKQKDIMLIAISVFIGGVFSFVIARAVISGGDHKTSVEVVQPITADFPEPDKEFFNANAINPTQLIRIGEEQNPQPFGAR